MLNCQKLYELMCEKGVKSIKELSSLSRIPYTTLVYMKTGHDMQVSTLVQLAKFFQVPIDYLVNSTYNICTLNRERIKSIDTTNMAEAVVLSMM